MIKIVLLALLSSISASPAYQSISLGDDGSYQFFYETGKEAGSHSREESRGADGVVVGKYSYQDPTGDIRVVNYRADKLGYVAKGDVGVAGAAEAQLPAEGHQAPEDSNGDSKEATTEGPTVATSPNSVESPDIDDEEYEDDVKAMKLQEPSYDGPPDGFPIGFFDHGFQGLRRLPEPAKEDKAEDKVKKNEDNTDGENQDEDEGSKDGENEDKDEGNKDEEKTTASLRAFLPFYHLHAHAGHLHPLPENPYGSYQYTYHHPNGHGYFYTF